jgi:L-ascorbate metabolism protein UlaG (beta-lactamase superfamily)
MVLDPFLTGNPAADIPVERLAKVDAVLEFVRPRTVIPMHYNTWDVIKADPDEFARRVGARAEVVVLRPGQSYTLA